MNEKLDEQLKHTIEELGPDEKQTDAIWRSVQTHAQHKTKKFPAFRVAAAGMCVLALCVVTGAGVNAATDGAFFESVRAFVGMQEQQKKVANEGLELGRRASNVYADPLVACSDDYIIFANERGLMIYDRQEASVLAALDLQALDCNYFNADTIVTHVMMQQNMLYIFNEYQDADTTEVYTYDLSQVGLEKALDRVDDASEIANIQSEWKKYDSEHYKDTFDTVPAAQKDWNDSRDLRYSRDSVVWTNAKGEAQISCLLVHGDGSYELYTCSADDLTQTAEEELTINDTKEDTLQGRLPVFVYTGDDMILKTLCDYMGKQDYGYDTEDAVFIPAPVVYGTVTKGDEVIVFANLWSYTYKRNGNTLDCEAGGEQPSRLKLKADGNGGYTIEEHLTAGDGADYVNDIKAFCKGYQISSDKFITEGQKYQDIRKKLIQMYVADNQLDIEYFKDYGWDPVSLKDTIK